ncbi:MAG: hypothetical protein ACYS6K_25155 [Planctomycetota bacterium]|jgi:hypothetical protein
MTETVKHPHTAIKFNVEMLAIEECAYMRRSMVNSAPRCTGSVETAVVYTPKRPLLKE